MKVLF